MWFRRMKENVIRIWSNQVPPVNRLPCRVLLTLFFQGNQGRAMSLVLIYRLVMSKLESSKSFPLCSKELKVLLSDSCNCFVSCWLLHVTRFMSLFWQSFAYHSPPTQCFEIFCSIFENRPVICRCLFWWYFNFVICFVLFENQKVRFSAVLFSLPYRLRTLGRGRGQRPLAAPLSSPYNARKIIKHLGLTEASRRPAPSPFGSSELVNRGSGNKRRSDFKISSHLHEAYLNGDDCHCHCNQEKYFWRHFSFPYSFYVWRERVIFKLISFGHWVCSSLATNLECFHSSLKRFSNGFYSVTRSLLNFSILPAGHSENLWSKFLSTGGEWGPVISSFDRSARNRSSSSSWFLFIRRTLF